MGTLTIGLSGSGVVNGAKTYTISDADVTHLLAVMAKRYQKTDAQGLVVVQTNAQVLVTWANGLVAATIDQVRQDDLSVAQAAIALTSIGIA